MQSAGRLLAIGSADLVLGLGLLGIEGVEAHDAAEARDALQRALADPRTALVLIDEVLAEGLRATLEAAAQAAGRALVVEVPSATGMAGGEPLHRRVEQALGFQLRE